MLNPSNAQGDLYATVRLLSAVHDVPDLTGIKADEHVGGALQDTPGPLYQLVTPFLKKMYI